ncbi:MAG: thioredoxin family protein [Acidobacteriota bacterium]|nr:thioredoxin family protein [Acidobacteriota bacterium]
MRAIVLLMALMSATTFAYASRREIYPPPEQAKADLAAALNEAAKTHKRIILDFGGNWCSDCIVLDMYMHNEQNLPILNANFIMVHINVGRYDANLDLAKKYDTPLDKGVPALAVLLSSGKLLYSQKLGQFESMRRVEPDAVTKFLLQWKPVKPGCSMVMTTC